MKSWRSSFSRFTIRRSSTGRARISATEIFYTTPAQQQTAERLIGELRRRGYDVVTEVTPAGRFWPAEDYHQQYYKRKGTLPYCHAYTKRF